MAAGPAAPLQDAQRALRLVRAMTSAKGLDPKRVGVMGYSAPSARRRSRPGCMSSRKAATASACPS